ncbi:transcriptional regulator [Lactococcus hodotermopsidis]|uniref:Transcriptional regulator n=1 Tax=Pseudolactococcus hodotermopsidis TaxID=2709157 RepID=A0A6A0BBT5_9LACT|nr:nicotinamide-nucleotide adenylyltransferase [Lactococcus hodotermopsidis]GFH42850.1 transcriptional regulator [Lactococcus hodotermopsidis]
MINRKRLQGKKIGVYFGTFAPLHTGHQQQIYKTAALNDGVLLIVSGYDNDRGSQIGLHLNKRFRYLREAFNDEPEIQVAKLDENDIPEMPNGWDEWSNRLFELIRATTVAENLEITFYVGEVAYVTELRQRFPKNDGNTYAVEIADRQDIQLSATMIREQPLVYWQDINRVFRRHFSKVVTVMGSAETGKSTLVRRLARAINAPFSEEYAQFYEKKSNIDVEELGVADYVHLIRGQYDANSCEINSPANQGLVFLDTDVLVTRVYAKLYLSEREQATLEPLFQQTICDEQMDLILVVAPVTKSDDNDFHELRQVFHEELMRQLAEFGLMDKVVLLDDTGDKRDSGGYLSRYHHAIDAVKAYTGIEIKRLEY